MLRFYRVDILDFYRGTLSSRRLGVLIRQLPPDAALVRALNDGLTPWTNTDHRIADLWALRAGKDHPVREAMEAKSKHAAKLARAIELKTTFEKRQRTYGLGGEVT